MQLNLIIAGLLHDIKPAVVTISAVETGMGKTFDRAVLIRLVLCVVIVKSIKAHYQLTES